MGIIEQNAVNLTRFLHFVKSFSSLQPAGRIYRPESLLAVWTETLPAPLFVGTMYPNTPSLYPCLFDLASLFLRHYPCFFVLTFFLPPNNRRANASPDRMPYRPSPPPGSSSLSALPLSDLCSVSVLRPGGPRAETAFHSVGLFPPSPGRSWTSDRPLFPLTRLPSALLPGPGWTLYPATAVFPGLLRAKTELGCPSSPALRYFPFSRVLSSTRTALRQYPDAPYQDKNALSPGRPPLAASSFYQYVSTAHSDRASALDKACGAGHSPAFPTEGSAQTKLVCRFF